MNQLHLPVTSFRLIRLLLPLLTLSLAAVMFMTAPQPTTSQQYFPPATPTPPGYIEATSEVDVTDTLRETYSPAHYGIPERINGYRVLAVRSAENTACMRTDELRLHIQTDDTAYEHFVANNRQTQVQQAVDALEVTYPGIMYVTVWIVGPATSLDHLIQGNERWNTGKHEMGCGGNSPIIVPPTPVITPGPTPTLYPFDQISYSPDKFHLPRSVGGYDILAVMDIESITGQCQVFGAMRLLVRAKRPIIEEYGYGGYHELLAKLQQISTLQIIIDFVEPDTTQTEVNAIIAAQVQRLEARGCPTMRLGPIPMQVPTIP